MKKILLVCAMISLPVMAVINEGEQQFRLAQTVSSGDELFVGDNERSVKAATSGGFKKMDISSTALGTSWGVAHGGQVDLGLIYSQVDLGTKEIGGISQLSAHYRKSLFAGKMFNVEGGLGIRTPGNNRNGDQFDSYNDGQIKYDYILDFGYSPLSWLTLSLSNRFTDRASEGSKSQRLHDLGASFQVLDTTYVRPFYQVFSTRSGRDISDSDFSDKFSEVKEKWNAAGLTVGHQLNSSLGFDVSYFKKLTSGAENTNSAAGFVFGLNYSL